MGPRQKPHGEGLLYDYQHVKHTAVAATICVAARKKANCTVFFFFGKSVRHPLKALLMLKICQIAGGSRRGISGCVVFDLYAFFS